MSDIKENKPQTPVPVQAQEQGVWDSVKETIGSTFSGVSSAYHEYFTIAKGYFDVAKKEYTTLNNEGPAYLSNFKRDFVFPVNEDYRTFAHMGVTLSWIVLSLKFKRGMFLTLRDSIFLYYTYGAIFNPEAVNPFLK